MRVSFDLDEVLFVSPETHKTEPPLIFPLRILYKERLRLGTPALLRRLQELGYEVWIYTSSFRSEKYIRRLFRCYGVRLDGIVNGEEALKDHYEANRAQFPGEYEAEKEKVMKTLVKAKAPAKAKELDKEIETIRKTVKYWKPED